MKTYANQKVVTVCKAISDANNPYGIINKECAMEAARRLDAGAYKLWVFFELQADNYTFALSSKFVAEEFGMKKKQYDKAVATLIDCGYLNNTVGNKYEFVEAGLVPKGNKVLPQEDSLIDETQTLYQKDTSLVSKGNNTLYQKDTTPCTKKVQALVPKGYKKEYKEYNIEYIENKLRVQGENPNGLSPMKVFEEDFRF